MDEVRRERAVELSFEGFRFNDLQRWLLLTEEPYTIKTSQEFERVENEDFYKNNDPAEAEVRNFREETILKRVFGTKHYWFPHYWIMTCICMLNSRRIRDGNPLWLLNV